MGFIRLIVSYIASLLKTLVYDGPRALLDIWRHLLALIRASNARRRLPKWQRISAKSDCVPIREPAFHRPDPLIYSQYFLIEQGIAVTWDNPDIVLRRGGVEVPSYALEPNTDYEIVARIWNGSTNAPVVDLPVHFSYLSFGVGTLSHPIGSTEVDLGVKGGPNHPAFALMKWKTPNVPGHYCLQVVLEWFDDLNPHNNLGQENTNVGQPQSPVIFVFKLRNAALEARSFRFEVDTYQIPEPPPCPEEEMADIDPLPTTLAVPTVHQSILERHDRKKFPLPSGWSIAVQPDQPDLQAGAETDIRVVVTPPENFRGRQPININAFSSTGLAGGVTLYVTREGL